jgi:hypothetical protein
MAEIALKFSQNQRLRTVLQWMREAARKPISTDSESWYWLRSSSNWQRVMKLVALVTEWNPDPQVPGREVG